LAYQFALRHLETAAAAAAPEAHFVQSNPAVTANRKCFLLWQGSRAVAIMRLSPRYLDARQHMDLHPVGV